VRPSSARRARYCSWLLERLLDQLLLGAIEVRFLARSRGGAGAGAVRVGARPREREKSAAVKDGAVGEDDGALAGVAQRATLPGQS